MRPFDFVIPTRLGFAASFVVIVVGSAFLFLLCCVLLRVRC